jgi:hypothetical protein
LEMGVPRTIFPGWLWTMIFSISAPQVARIIGMSHWRLAPLFWCHSYQQINAKWLLQKCDWHIVDTQ